MHLSKLSYFSTLNEGMSPSLIAEIHSKIQENKNYAYAIWKSRGDDAIDATLHHAMKYYSKDKGELGHYILSTMKNILKNQSKKETPQDDYTLHFLVDLNQDDSDKEMEELLISIPDEVSECVLEFIPYLISDYYFFKERDKRKMKGNYSSILSSFSAEVVISALDVIKVSYLPKISDFIETIPESNSYKKPKALKDTCSRYKSHVEVKEIINEAALVEGYSPKTLYSINLRDLSMHILSKVYTDDSGLKTKFNFSNYYWSPSLSILEGGETIILSLMEYCLHYLCKNENYTVSGFRGDVYYLLGFSNISKVDIFGITIPINMDSVSRKEI